MPAEDSVREGQEEGGSLFFRTPGRIFILWLRLLLQVALARRFGVLQMLGSGHNLISLVGIVMATHKGLAPINIRQNYV